MKLHHALRKLQHKLSRLKQKRKALGRNPMVVTGSWTMKTTRRLLYSLMMMRKPTRLLMMTLSKLTIIFKSFLVASPLSKFFKEL